MNGVPRRRISSTAGWAIRVTTSSAKDGGRPVEGRVGAHATGVRPLVVVADPLEVLGRAQRQDRLAVAEAEERDLGAVEELLDDDPSARLGEAGRAWARAASRSLGDDDSLAGGEAVVLDDVRRAQRVERRLDLCHGRAHVGQGRRDLGRCHDVLGERLAALEPGSLGRRPEDRGCPPRAPRRPLPRRAGPPGPRRRGRRRAHGPARRCPRRRADLAGSGSHRAMASMPGLPGAAMTASTSWSAARALTMACSRAPVPMTRTFTGPA